MKRLYFLRHGQSVLNVAGKFAGTIDTPLTETGEQQALTAGQQAREIMIDLIICSPQTRAHQTAILFAKGAGLHQVQIITNDLLTERNFGVLEGEPYSPTLSHSLFGDNLPEGMESWQDLTARSQKLINHVMSLPANNILLVSHGSTGRALRSIVEPTADKHAGIPNAELVRWI